MNKFIFVSATMIKVFLKQVAAVNLNDELHASFYDLQELKMLQLYMDGPNTNWKVLELLNKFRCKKKWNGLLNLESCGLPVINGVFQTGVKVMKWKIKKLSKVIWKIFDESWAVRDLHIRVAESE